MANPIVLAIFVVLVSSSMSTQTERLATPGDASAGKALFEAPGIECNRCHGNRGEGGFGPILAGRNLAPATFEEGLRRGRVMPAYSEQLITAREAADMLAYLNSLPRVTEPGPLRVTVPDDASLGQRLATQTVGCAQCHGAAFGSPRQALGALGPDADFEWFKRMVYDHTTEMPQFAKAVGQPLRPRLVMGDYSRAGVQESVLRQIYEWTREDLGIRAPVAGRLSAGKPSATGMSYTITVENAGVAGKGMTAEGLTISMSIPEGATVVEAGPNGYQGVQRDEKGTGNKAVWQIPRLAAGERQMLTFSLSAVPTTAIRGAVTWVKPAIKGAPVDTANIFAPGGPGGAAPAPAATP